ncbi:MAG: hypothetical protein DI623_09535 [Sphingomonas sanxanigenens]|uniref:Lysozyme inhibitor LprI-like N-terminal domain-containing protein n=1 Tax=Sphingomonas sanxanigenens TaxID=397260 RepID=A0A2W5A8T9_9SPHN|nr:MAG: hypothetical protein DI623_09535 [Sphingomonas sanxanigenens]
MRHQFIILLVLVIALSGSAAWGEERDEDDCLRLRPGIASSVEMATCTSDLSGSQQALADALANLRAHIPRERRNQLDKAQRAWLAYRDEHCLWEAGGNPGSTGYSAAVIACAADMNRERTKYLRDDLRDRW